MPSNLKDQLRVLASHDRVRRLSQASCSARLRHWGSRLQLAFDNLMRPIALPFAGGVLSALFLFGMWVPTMATPRITMGDVPVPIYTPVPPMALINPVSQGGDVVVQLIIDERGRVTDYTVIHGQDSPELMNMILFSKWAPATFFGQPTWGTAVWSHSEIKVKG